MAQCVEALRYTPEGRGLDIRWGHWNFSLTYSLGVKADSLVTSSRNSRRLKLLEPYGPVQACNGTALPTYKCTNSFFILCIEFHVAHI